jgi:hypothetical protein
MIQALENIKEIRSRNNDLWMAILDIALRVDPDQTRSILREIQINDRAVTAKLEDILSR